jgi:hypothetical protein
MCHAILQKAHFVNGHFRTGAKVCVKWTLTKSAIHSMGRWEGQGFHPRGYQ